MGIVFKPVRSFLIVIGVDMISFSCSDPVTIFDNLDRRLIGDSRRATKEQINPISKFYFAICKNKALNTRIHAYN
jgi:hypothetical protein